MISRPPKKQSEPHFSLCVSLGGYCEVWRLLCGFCSRFKGLWGLLCDDDHDDIARHDNRQPELRQFNGEGWEAL